MVHVYGCQFVIFCFPFISYWPNIRRFRKLPFLCPFCQAAASKKKKKSVCGEGGTNYTIENLCLLGEPTKHGFARQK